MKPSANQTEHIYHPLNQSKTKNAYSFQKSDRFHLAKRFSFIDLASRPTNFMIYQTLRLENLPPLVLEIAVALNDSILLTLADIR